MSDLFFCGDTHGEFQHVIDAVKLHRPVAIIFLGDLQAKRPLEVELEEIIDLTEVWFIHGNHDTDSRLCRRLGASISLYSNGWGMP